MFNTYNTRVADCSIYTEREMHRFNRPQSRLCGFTFFFRTISKRDAPPPHARIICTMKPPRSENAKSFGARTTLRGPVVVISYYYYYYFFPRSVELYYIVLLLYLIGKKPVTPPRVISPRNIKKNTPCFFPPRIQCNTSLLPYNFFSLSLVLCTS